MNQPNGALLNGAAPGELNLDDLIAVVDIAPRKVRFAGTVYSVRRDLKGADIVQYWALIKSKKDVEALSLLVGPVDAVTLNVTLDSMPQLQMNVAVQHFMQTAGLVGTGGEAGESTAS